MPLLDRAEKLPVARSRHPPWTVGGGWNITCEVSFKSETKNFRNYTTDSIFIDEISNMKADDASFDEIQNAYYEHSFHKMEEEVAEWIEEILTEENED